MGRRNREYAENALSWEHIGARYLSLYSGVRVPVRTRSPLAELPSSSW
jgi:hypothetical protein